MNKFLKNVLLFSLILFAVVVSIECFLLFQINIYSYKRQYVETHIDDIQVLLFGNSHIDQAIDPCFICSGSFNFAIQGRSKIYDMELAKRYIPQMHNLKVVIMPLDYFDFHFGRVVNNAIEKKDLDNDKYSSTYKCMYYKYMGIHVDGCWYWSEVLNSKLNYMTRFFKSYEDARECDSLGYVRYEKDRRRQGWQYERLPDGIDLKKEINQKMYNELLMYYSVIAQVAEQEGVRFILLSTPLYITYQKCMNDSVCKEMIHFVDDLKNQYSNIEYYNFMHDKSFSEDDFYDASHLNRLGAVKFSKIVSEIVQSEMIRR